MYLLDPRPMITVCVFENGPHNAAIAEFIRSEEGKSAKMYVMEGVHADTQTVKLLWEQDPFTLKLVTEEQDHATATRISAWLQKRLACEVVLKPGDVWSYYTVLVNVPCTTDIDQKSPAYDTSLTPIESSALSTLRAALADPQRKSSMLESLAKLGLGVVPILSHQHRHTQPQQQQQKKTIAHYARDRIVLKYNA